MIGGLFKDYTIRLGLISTEELTKIILNLWVTGTNSHDFSIIKEELYSRGVDVRTLLKESL